MLFEKKITLPEKVSKKRDKHPTRCYITGIIILLIPLLAALSIILLYLLEDIRCCLDLAVDYLKSGGALWLIISIIIWTQLTSALMMTYEIYVLKTKSRRYILYSFLCAFLLWPVFLPAYYYIRKQEGIDNLLPIALVILSTYTITVVYFFLSLHTFGF